MDFTNSQLEILPPLDIQQQIVSEIEGYQKIIDGAKQVVNNYKPTISINPDWEMVELGTVCDFVSGYAFESTDFSPNKGAKSIKITNVGVGDFVEVDSDYLPESFYEKHKRYSAIKGDIAIALTRPIIDSGIKVCLVPETYNNALVNQRVALVRPLQTKAEKYFIYHYLSSPIVVEYVKEKSKTLMQPNLSIKDLGLLAVPLPTLEEQLTIVKAIEEELQLVNANKRLIEIFEQKIKTKIGEVWGVKEEVETV
ncbi:MAG: restriction endonuclease subunit S [Bacteroidetes bacterium]|nr:restriction endonuclease subunit S [Bacteroidota bacterium]